MSIKKRVKIKKNKKDVKLVKEIERKQSRIIRGNEFDGILHKIYSNLQTLINESNRFQYNISAFVRALRFKKLLTDEELNDAWKWVDRRSVIIEVIKNSKEPKYEKYLKQCQEYEIEFNKVGLIDKIKNDKELKEKEKERLAEEFNFKLEEENKNEPTG